MEASLPAAAPKRTRRDRREDILEKATQLFGKYGFQGTTLALVAEAVGLTEPGVLHYFPSKVHLLQGVLEDRDQKSLARYAPLIEAEAKSLADLFNQTDGVFAEDELAPGLIQLYSVLVGESIRRDHPSHDYFVERYRRGRDIYAQQFRKMGVSDIRSDVDLDLLAALMMAVMDGLQTHWLLDPEDVKLRPTYRLFGQIVTAFLQSRDTHAQAHEPGATTE